MHPIIGQIGPFTIYAYGVSLAVAAVVCSFLLSCDAKRKGLDPNVILDMVFWTVLGGLLGARFFFVLLNLDFFVDYPLEAVMIHHGGLAWQGGLFGGTLVAFFFIKRKKFPLGETADFVAPYVALGQAIGRIGCFLNGCCYGKEVAWGIYFPVHAAHLHPTQLYSAAGLFIIFCVLRKYQRATRRQGEVFFLYLILASAERFAVEFFRADHDTLWMGLSVFQVVSLVVLVCGLCLYGKLYLQNRSGK